MLTICSEDKQTDNVKNRQTDEQREKQ